MRNDGKRNVLGILIDAVDYDGAMDVIFGAARERRAIAVSALAVHGLMTGVLDGEQKFRLNHFDVLLPDGQPVRWALNLIHHARLPARVYGPDLTIKVCARAEAEGLAVYFYGSTSEVLTALKMSLARMFPRLQIAGMEASQFRRLTADEKAEIAARVRTSGASIFFVGLGCPRQEIFAYEFRGVLEMPILAVGAAFAFLAGKTPQAPPWMQDAGLEWLFRLCTEPRRLWRRYLLLSPVYMVLFILQILRLLDFPTKGKAPTEEMLFG